MITSLSAFREMASQGLFVKNFEDVFNRMMNFVENTLLLTEVDEVCSSSFLFRSASQSSLCLAGRRVRGSWAQSSVSRKGICHFFECHLLVRCMDFVSSLNLFSLRPTKTCHLPLLKNQKRREVKAGKSRLQRLLLIWLRRKWQGWSKCFALWLTRPSTLPTRAGTTFSPFILIRSWHSHRLRFTRVEAGKLIVKFTMKSVKSITPTCLLSFASLATVHYSLSKSRIAISHSLRTKYMKWGEKLSISLVSISISPPQYLSISWRRFPSMASILRKIWSPLYSFVSGLLFLNYRQKDSSPKHWKRAEIISNLP